MVIRRGAILRDRPAKLPLCSQKVLEVGAAVGELTQPGMLLWQGAWLFAGASETHAGPN